MSPLHPSSCQIVGFYGSICLFLGQKKLKSPILANIAPSMREPLARFSQSLYNICTLRVYIIRGYWQVPLHDASVPVSLPL